MAPAFTVVIPTYNQADYLRVALKSVLDQSFRDFEVIIVNNHSTDHTLEVIQEFRDQRVQVIQFRNNGVIAASRNVGIKAGRAPFVAFLDSDDTWFQNKLQKVAEAIAARPDVGLVCHNQDLLREGRVTQRTFYGPSKGYEQDTWGHVVFVSEGPSTSATVVAKRHLAEVEYFPEDSAFVTAEDYDLWIKLADACRFLYLPDVLGTHNFHVASASANVELHVGAAIAVLDKHCRALKNSKRSYSRKVIRNRYANIYYGAGRQHQRRGGIKRSLTYYVRALKTNPFHQRAYAALALLLADLILGNQRRRTVVNALWRPSWRWG